MVWASKGNMVAAGSVSATKETPATNVADAVAAVDVAVPAAGALGTEDQGGIIPTVTEIIKTPATAGMRTTAAGATTGTVKEGVSAATTRLDKTTGSEDAEVAGAGGEAVAAAVAAAAITRVSKGGTIRTMVSLNPRVLMSPLRRVITICTRSHHSHPVINMELNKLEKISIQKSA